MSNMLASSNSLLYAVRILRSLGIPDHCIMSFLQLSSWSWPNAHHHGLAACAYSTAGHAKLESFNRWCKRLGYCSCKQLLYSQLTDAADETLFRCTTTYDWHILQPLLHDRPATPYSLRERSHNKMLLNKTGLKYDDFLIRYPFNGPFSGNIWILLKQQTVSGSGISWAICKSARCSRQITMPAPHNSSFLQARCPSCRPTNSVKALKAQALN